jgi:hypothetical protein
MLGHVLTGLDVPTGPQIGSFSLFSLVIGLIAALAVMLVIFGLIGERGSGDEMTRRLERYAEFGDRGGARVAARARSSTVSPTR